MHSLRRLFNFYLNASIHVAFGVFALVHVTVETFDFPRDGHLSWFLFFGTITCYNFVKYGVEAEKYFVVANSYQKHIQRVSFLALLFGFYHAIFLGKAVWTGLALLLFLTFLYAIPVLPQTKNLRSLGGLKIFIVALVWAGATVILSCLGAGEVISWDILVETLQRFLFVLALLVPFEIRDLQFDGPELRTIPQRFGVRATQWFGAFLALFFFLATFLKDDISIAEVGAKGAIFVLLEIMMIFSGSNQGKYFASFWVEGIPILWYLLLMVL